MNVNDEIRKTVRAAIKALPISQAEFARQIGVKPRVLNRALIQQGKVPRVWEDTLSKLGLTLTVRPAQAPAGTEGEA